VGRQLLFRHKVRDLNPSNKGETRRSMPFRMNRRMTSTWRILFHPESKAKQNQTAISDNVTLSLEAGLANRPEPAGSR
jgi:hypothetical protein